METNGLTQKKSFYLLIKIPTLNLYWNQNDKSMLPNCRDHFGHKKNKKKQHNKKQTKKTKKKINKKKNGNNSTYYEPLSEKWIGRRSWILHQISS